jgi:Fis family transcriptional regulator
MRNHHQRRACAREISGKYVDYRGTTDVNVSSVSRIEAAADSGLQPALRECVARAVRRYLHDVGTCPVDGLHELVLREVELPLLREVLTWYGGNQSRAAAALGINRATLRKKMQHYGLAV